MAKTRRARLVLFTTLGIAALGAGLGCNAILGLEEIAIAPSGLDSGVGDAGLTGFCAERPTACGTFCKGQASPIDAGALLYCNDFDQLDGSSAGDFGFSGDSFGPIGTIKEAIETARAASPPNALRLEVSPASGPTARVVSTKIGRSPTAITIRFSIGIDLPNAAAENRTIALVVFGLEGQSGSAIVFGVDEGRYFLSRTKSSLDIQTSELKAEAVRLEGVLPRPEYDTLVLSIEDATSCVTRQPDVGTLPGPLAVFARRSRDTAPFYDAPLACKVLPVVTPFAETDVSVGGFIKDPVAALRWRFDNVLVRAR